MSVRAIWAGAGNCGEHALLATLAHASRLDADAGETVVMLGNALIDHGWAESVIPRPWNLSSLWKPDEEAIVLDAWRDGPAVFAEDSTRTQAQWLTSFTFGRITTPQPELLADAKAAAQHLAIETDPRAPELKRPPPRLLLDPRPIVSSALVERVSLKPLSVEQVLEAVRKSSLSVQPEALHPAMPAQVRKQILAAGVARNLMDAPEPLEQTKVGRGRVWSAARQAQDIADAVGDLTKSTPRRYRPSFPATSFFRFSYGSSAPGVVRRPTETRFDVYFLQQRDV